MNMTEFQFGALVISLSTLGQADISEVDTEKLETLDHLLERALENVRRTLTEKQDTSNDEEPTSNPEYAPTPDSSF